MYIRYTYVYILIKRERERDGSPIVAMISGPFIVGRKKMQKIQECRKRQQNQNQQKLHTWFRKNTGKNFIVTVVVHGFSMKSCHSHKNFITSSSRNWCNFKPPRPRQELLRLADTSLNASTHAAKLQTCHGMLAVGSESLVGP